MAMISIPAGDLALENGTLVFCSGAAFYRQKLAARFKFFLGEWFLDQRLGLPYYQNVFVKNPDLDLIRSLFRRVILTTPGIKSIKTFTLSFDPAARKLSFSFHALLVGDEAIVVRPQDRDFIIDLSA
jgi:hypothetical protein